MSKRPCEEEGPLNVVTVGDGDLSFSLALARSTRNTQLLATTFSSASDVRGFYRNAAAIVEVRVPGECRSCRCRAERL
jgi:hypothetical protein